MNRKVFLWVITVVHFLFLGMAMVLEGYQIPDSYDYRYQAENLLNEGSFYAWNAEETIKEDYFTKRTPGYAVMIALMGNQVFLILLAQVGMSLLVFFGLYRFLTTSGFSEKRTGWFLIILLLFQSNQLIYATTIVSEIPFQLVLCSAIWLFWKGHHEKQSRKIHGSVWLFSLAVLIKPVLLFFWIPLAGFLVYEQLRIKRSQLWLAVFIMPMVILSWSAYNYSVTGSFHYSSISTVNLRDYNTRLMLESVYGLDSANATIQGIKHYASGFPDYAQRQAATRDTCIELIKQYPLAYTKVHVKGMLAMLVDPGRYDWANFLHVDTAGSGLMYDLAAGNYSGMLQTIREQHPLVTIFFFLNLIGAIALVVLALLGIFRWRLDTFRLLIILGVCLYFWVLTGPVGSSRYKSAILPLLAVLAAQGVMRPLNPKA